MSTAAHPPTGHNGHHNIHLKWIGAVLAIGVAMSAIVGDIVRTSTSFAVMGERLRSLERELEEEKTARIKSDEKYEYRLTVLERKTLGTGKE